jgi:hypothetical protein
MTGDQLLHETEIMEKKKSNTEADVSTKIRRVNQKYLVFACYGTSSQPALEHTQTKPWILDDQYVLKSRKIMLLRGYIYSTWHP